MSWQCELGKWSFISKSHGTYYEGYMFPLLVKEQLDFWPEKHVRRRIWVCYFNSFLLIIIYSMFFKNNIISKITNSYYMYNLAENYK